MKYATWEFYKEKYYGSSIASEADFNKWLLRAGQIMNRYTYNRLVRHFPDDEDTRFQIALCACELSEKVMEIDRYMQAGAIKENGETTMVKSKSAGSESVTFATGETAYDKLVTDDKALERFYYNTVKLYLSEYGDATGTNLIYAGV